jgi:uncharacterized protein
MANDLIRYDLLVQDALKGVVRKVLGDAGRDGLSGDHHFYISFRTDAPGVRMSQRLRERYPEDITIVLQHQFWDLSVTEHAFEVGLSFSGVSERLLVPFDALTGFFDPSVQFGLKFGEREEGAAEPTPPPGKSGHARGAGSEPAEAAPKKPAVPAVATNPLPKLAPKPAREVAENGGKPSRALEVVKPDEKRRSEDEAAASAEVVSLDAFRKKS